MLEHDIVCECIVEFTLDCCYSSHGVLALILADEVEICSVSWQASELDDCIKRLPVILGQRDVTIDLDIILGFFFMRPERYSHHHPINFDAEISQSF